MRKSLIEELPDIVRDGKREAQRILEGLETNRKIALQTRELVLPKRNTGGLDLYSGSGLSIPDQPNRLIFGDNLLAIAALLAGDDQHESMRGKIDLIYIDPPFDSKADYRSKIMLPAANGSLDSVEVSKRPTVAEQTAYSDTWAEGTASYLRMITPRLVLMRELLKDTGSIYIHVGTQVNHVVKLIADSILGKRNFVEEIIWSYGSPSGGRAAGTKLVKTHEYILHYAHVYSSRFESKQYLPYSDSYVRDWFKWTDEEGRRYRRRQRGRGQWEKQYLDESKGVPISTVWTDLKQVYADPRAYKSDQSNHSEITGYATQKPEKLLRRIVEHSCPEGGLVADFFVGSGTTAAVAEKLGRRWIAVDQGKPAVMITRKRLVDIDNAPTDTGYANPFLYQAVGDYQVEQARNVLGKKFRIGDLARVVLGLYGDHGALPLPAADNPNGSLGQVNNRELVFVDSPNKVTGPSALKRAQVWRDSLLGGFETVTVLGWNFAPGISEVISSLRDDRLKVLAIPANLLDELKKKGEKNLQGNVHFSTLQYLDAHLTFHNRHTDADGNPVDELTVELDNYVLMDPFALPLDKNEDRERVLAVMSQEPLALIEYWAVDPDYDGLTFRSTWQDYRDNDAADDDPLRTGTVATVTVPAVAHDRTIAVRAVDIFGYESEKLLRIRPNDSQQISSAVDALASGAR